MVRGAIVPGAQDPGPRRLWPQTVRSVVERGVVIMGLTSCRDSVVRLSAAITNNHRAALTHLDLSDNLLEDKGQTRWCSR